MKKMVKVLVVAVVVGVSCAAVCFAGGKARPPVVRTFVGTSGIYTNGNEPVAVAAAFLSSDTNANLKIVVENVTGYENTVAYETSATNETSFIDGAGAVSVWKAGLVKFTGGAGTNEYTIYFKDHE